MTPRQTATALIANITLGIVGCAMLALVALAPQSVDRFYGDYLSLERATMRTLVQAGVVTDPAGPPSEPGSEYLPSLALAGPGGDAQLDECAGTFTEYEPYRDGQLQPVFAAQNYRGGAVILDIAVGDRLRITDTTGTEQIYTVMQMRDVPKTGDTSDLRGMHGALLLQTCYFGSSTMRIVAAQARSLRSSFQKGVGPVSTTSRSARAGMNF